MCLDIMIASDLVTKRSKTSASMIYNLFSGPHSKGIVKLNHHVRNAYCWQCSKMKYITYYNQSRTELHFLKSDKDDAILIDFYTPSLGTILYNLYCTRDLLCMRPANKRRRYIVTPSSIGWTHTQNGPCAPSEETPLTLIFKLDCTIVQTKK